MDYPYPVIFCSKGHWEGCESEDDIHEEFEPENECKDFKGEKMEFKNLKEARDKGGLVNIHEVKTLMSKTGGEIRKLIKSDDFPHVKVGRFYMFDLEKVKSYAKEKGL